MAKVRRAAPETLLGIFVRRERGGEKNRGEKILQFTLAADPVSPALCLPAPPHLLPPPPHLRPSPPPGLRAVPVAAPAGGAAVFNPCRAPTCTRPGPGLRDGEVRQLAPLRTGCSGLALTEAGRDEGEEGKPEEWRRMSLARCLQRVNTRN